MDNKTLQDKTLQSLVDSGELSSYSLIKEYSDPEVEMETTQRLELAFPSGEKLVVRASCSGVLGNAELIFST